MFWSPEGVSPKRASGEAMTPEAEKISESPPGTRLAQTGEQSG